MKSVSVEYLRCLIYELNVLATSIEELLNTEDDRLGEVYKTAALIKLRTVYDFFHRPAASDTIKLSHFEQFAPTVPEAMPREWDVWLHHQSINTYIAHLDANRITKEVPQPKFERGDQAVIKTAIQLLGDGRTFVKSVVSHQDFTELNRFGQKWWNEFQQTMSRLEMR